MRAAASILALVAASIALAACSSAPATVATSTDSSCLGSGCAATVSPQNQYAPPPATPLTVNATTPAAPAVPAEPVVPAKPAQTVSQANAIDSAQGYLDYTAFSRTGLIKQLKFEKYSTADATYAVDHITVDWTEQAGKSAKSYMDYSSFSRAGLISQLKFEGFTRAQAEHGATSVGL